MSMFDLEIAGAALRVSRLHGRAALSELFQVDVRAAILAAPPAIADLLGSPFTLVLRDTFERSLSLRGIVTSVERRAVPRGGTYALTLEPEVAKLAIGQDSRVFQDMSVVDIVTKVLEGAGITSSAVRWSTSGSYKKHPYRAQHRESDWAFVERLLAEEGIYYWFDFTEDATVLVFSDDSASAPEIEDGATVPFHDDDMLQATRDAVFRVGASAGIAPEKVRLRDYNPDKPRLTLEATAGDGPHEIYDFHGRFGLPAEGDQLARVRLEALRARARTTFGEASSTRIRAGMVFELIDHPVESLNDRYLVASVTYDALELRAGDAAGVHGLQVAWSAIPAATPFRAPQARQPTSAGGPQTGVVVGPAGQEIHPDKSGRVRVQFYWDREGKRDEKASTWMRVGQFPLGGSMLTPRVGWDVLVEHHEGDIDAPVVQAHLYDGQHPVPYPLPADKTRTALKTATTPGGGSANEVRFEDKKGGEEIFLNASKDMNLVTGDNKDEVVGVDYTHTIGSNHEITIGADQTIAITSKQDVTIGASESLTVQGKRNAIVGGAESATIGASRTVSAAGGSNLDAKGGRTLTVGGSMTAASAMSVGRSTLGSMSVTVGGSLIQATATGLDTVTGGAAAETVGGAKILVGATGCDTSVKGAMAETVGGAYIVAAGGNAGESATGALAITVGGAFIGNAPSIEIEAADEISIRVGGASLKMTDGSVEIKAPSLASPGATIDCLGSQIHHN